MQSLMRYSQERLGAIEAPRESICRKRDAKAEALAYLID